jgi:hypothetical protein
LRECLDADALLLLQDASCNRQIPAKAYEYLRANKPILALTAEEGETAALLRRTGGSTLVDLRDEDGIASVFPEFLARVRGGAHPVPDATVVASYGRRRQSGELGKLLSQVVQDTRPPVRRTDTLVESRAGIDST